MIDTLINVYLPHFFDWLIETSLMASILVGFILCIKVLFRNKLTPRWQYMLWIVLMIRLLLPWSPDSSYSIYSLLSYSSSVSEVIPKNMPAAESIVNIESDRKVEFESNSETVTKNSGPEVKAGAEQQTAFSLYKIALYVWLAGVIILAVITFITNRRLYSYIKKQPDITDEQVVTVFNRCKQSMKMKKAVSLRLAGKIASPTVFSFFRPKVLLSKKHMKVLNEQQLQYVFYHELAHIKRNDVAVNWIMYSLLLLNWFNPILWYAYFCMREDQELACDAYALTFIDKEEQIAYGHTIITLLEHYSYQAPSLANLSRNKRTLKRRIVMIKKFQKKSYRLSLLGVIAIVAIASLSLFNARATEGQEKQEDQVEQSKDAFQNAVDMLYGTEENAKKEYHYSARVYEQKTDYIYLAEKALTKDEFQQYIKLSKEIINIQKKGAPRDSDYESIFFREERLTEADRDKLYALYDQAKPFDDKVHESLNYTVKEAQEHVDFQIKKPTYTIEGYNLKDEKVSYFIKRRPELIIDLEYTNGKGNYAISQSQVFGESKDPFHALFVVEENIEQYELEGNQIYYATHNSHSNLQGMKMIVPAKGKNSAYQIVIINHSLENPGEAVFDKNVNKEELEKVMLSMLK
ncbi:MULTISPECIES: M56 family metallopeptidase [Bacillus]|uniref:M56 family metallopeptidase n=1 Tax=Bacillus TaxID=1386 RepID=UPI000BFC16BE|nr:M56 family metallopeptidase [Bacillus cereus]PGW11368.1 methicillin resistance protein [Bacillus cereus]RFB11949.1 methicillin resistance protein [Bacillus sp. OE]RFB27795.1 methicillin resistance protein [Bacillus sp. LB(2018)]HDR6298631.1 M56 family metallopeptidase [Bacillus cereus]